MRLKYPLSDAPCWVCTDAAKGSVAYEVIVGTHEALSRAVNALRMVAAVGFELANELRCSNFEGRASRNDLERERKDLVSRFRASWNSALPIVAFSEPRCIRLLKLWDTAHDAQYHSVDGYTESDAPVIATSAYLMMGIEEFSDRDPRFYFRQGDPTLHDEIDASSIERVAGRLAHIARLVRRMSAIKLEALRRARGDDAMDVLRKAMETSGGSSKQFALARQKLLTPPDAMTHFDDLVEARAATLRRRKRVSLRQRATSGETTAPIVK